MIKKIRKAVFPAAGLGTRFLPATKAVPKAMLTVIDQPVIQYVVDEARGAGIEHFIFVVGPQKNAIEEHFDLASELASTLRDRERTLALVELNRGISKTDTISYARQQTPLGLGHAIWCARDLIGDEPFAVLNPDVITRGKPGCLAQILETYYLAGGNVLSVEECCPDQTSRYGIVSAGERISDAAFRITTMAEKPEPGSAQSNLKMSGRYVLQPQIFMHLARHDVGFGGEIQLTDALIRLAEEQPIFGHRFRGRSFDCGSKEGFVAANIAFAFDNPKLASIVQREIDLFLREQSGPAPIEIGRG